jgi:F0F1-type ATP synthase membrane subunit b/b'
VRRLVLSATFGCALLFLGDARLAKAQSPQEYSAIDRLTPLRWANWFIFAAGLGYLIYRYGPPFFNARSADIQRTIEEATGLKLQGDFRRSEADRKMATLPAEIEKIRRQNDENLAREHERVLRETEAEIQHIHSNIDAEISALRLEGAQRLRRHTAEAAIALAERRLRDRLASGQDNFLPDFLNAVKRDGNQAANR